MGGWLVYHVNPYRAGIHIVAIIFFFFFVFLDERQKSTNARLQQCFHSLNKNFRKWRGNQILFIFSTLSDDTLSNKS